MKTILLVLSWLLLAAGTYVGLDYHQKQLAFLAGNEKQLAALYSANEDLKGQVDRLSQYSSNLREQLEAAHQEITARKAAPDEPRPLAPATEFTLPTTIVTTTGKTYESCRLDRAYPDGISIFHATGAARIPYAELDPLLAARFGYDPAAAQKFTEGETLRMQQSDAMRAQVTANEEAIHPVATPSPTPAGKYQKSAGEVASIQAQIRKLQDDLAHMKTYGSPGYRQYYRDKESQIRDLQAQLR